MWGEVIAIYHLSVSITSRGKGKSAVAAAAYRACEKMTNEYDGVTHDFTRKKEIVYKEILLPENAPTEYADRSILWNAVEKIEKAKNSRLARELTIALPVELNMKQNINLVWEYISENFVKDGMCADICIHNKNDGNPHAHVLLTARLFNENGTWGDRQKKIYILDQNGEKIYDPKKRQYKCKTVKTTAWDNRDKIEEWRGAWADIVNKTLEQNNISKHIDHRSFERQGIEKLPTIHIGVAASQMERKGITTDRGEANRNIMFVNSWLNLLDKMIDDIEKPLKPQLIIDLENSIKAKDSPGYEHWAKIFNLQQSARTLIYIQENGYKDMKSLQAANETAKSEYADVRQQISEINTEVKSLKTQKAQAEIYRNTLEIYKKYTASGQLSYFKNKYYEQHKTEIENHKKAKTYLL